MTRGPAVLRRPRLPMVGLAVAVTAALLTATLPASQAATTTPYVSDAVPVAPGCIVLDRQWSGVKVFLVQRRLGLLSSRDRYDAATTAAVTRFQQAHALPATGSVDRATWRALRLGHRFCLDRFTVQPTVAATAGRRARVDAMVTWALQQVGRRYVWGGAGRLGYDCSGLALQAMHAGGLVLPTVTTYLHQRQDFPTAAEIFHSGIALVPLAERRRGDLVFWGPPGSIEHMAVYLGHGRIVEAVRPSVRTSSLWVHSLPIRPRVARPFRVV